MTEETFQHSSRRNRTIRYTYKHATRPPGTQHEWKYRHNATGKREQKRQTESVIPNDFLSPGAYHWTYYLRGGAGEPLAYWEGRTSTQDSICGIDLPSGINTFLYPESIPVYGPEATGIREDVPRVSLNVDGTPKYRIVDHLATVRVELDPEGMPMGSYDHKPFGEQWRAIGPDTLRNQFNSREKDQETGMGHHDARDLESEIGRFMGVDELWESDARRSPYVYSRNNPLTVVDPSGLQGVEIGPSPANETLQENGTGDPGGAGVTWENVGQVGKAAADFGTTTAFFIGGGAVAGPLILPFVFGGLRSYGNIESNVKNAIDNYSDGTPLAPKETDPIILTINPFGGDSPEQNAVETAVSIGQGVKGGSGLIRAARRGVRTGDEAVNLVQDANDVSQAATRLSSTTASPGGSG